METFYKIQDFLVGKKTYIVSVILAVYSLAVAFGWLNWTPDQELAVFGLLGALLGTTIRAGIDKV
jgi:hypothetical protein